MYAKIAIYNSKCAFDGSDWRFPTLNGIRVSVRVGACLEAQGMINGREPASCALVHVRRDRIIEHRTTGAEP